MGTTSSTLKRKWTSRNAARSWGVPTLLSWYAPDVVLRICCAVPDTYIAPGHVRGLLRLHAVPRRGNHA
eukprot:1818396-Rhodomonas_salina.3